MCVLCVVEVSDSSQMGPLGQINQSRNIHSEAQHVLLDMCFPSCQFYKSIGGMCASGQCMFQHMCIQSEPEPLQMMSANTTSSFGSMLVMHL